MDTAADTPSVERGGRDSVSVGEALRVVLSGSRVAGGRAGLHQRVTWATSLRSRPPAFELRGGGEFVLASRDSLDGLRQVDSNLTIERILEGLAQAGAVALAVPAPVSDQARALADQLSLPLIELAPEASVLDAERGIIGLVLDRHNEMQTRASEFYRRLAQFSLEGRGLDAIVVEAARITGRVVAFEDVQFRLRTVAVPPEAERHTIDGTLLSAVEERSRLLDLVRTHPVSSTTPVAISLPAARWHMVRFAAPVVIRDRSRGFLSICGAEGSLSEFDQLAASRAAAICTLELAKEEAVLAAEQRAQRDLMDELLTPSRDIETTRRRAVQAGFDPNGAFAAFAFAVADGDPHVVLTAAAEAITRYSRQSGRPLLPRVESNELLVLCQLDSAPEDVTVPRSGGSDPPSAVEKTSEKPRATGAAAVSSRRPSSNADADAPDESSGTSDRRVRVIGDELFALAAGGGEQDRLCGGGSRIAFGLPALPQSAVEARDALRIGRRVQGGGRLLLYAELGLFRLLYVLRDSEELRAFHVQTLGPLEEYDRRSGQNLIETLEVYFACNGNLSQTAQRLHHHRNSLLYRIGRIQEISGLDLEDPEARLSLQLALKARQLLP